MRNGFIAAAMALSVASWNTVFGATINAGFDTGQTSTTTNYSIPPASGHSISLTEDVANSSTSGPWHKTLTNDSGSGFSSGDIMNLQETFTNTGVDAWTGWHEGIVSRTTISASDTVGFLFREGNLTVTADYGAGFISLASGVDFTLTTVPYSGPFVNNPGGFGNDDGWEQIDIALIPSRAIQTGDTLRINKSIFEVYGDTDPWQPGTAAEIAQYPVVPEPAGIVFGVAALALLARRPRPQRQVTLQRTASACRISRLANRA